jgi:ribose transport system substrate-binding protein
MLVLTQQPAAHATQMSFGLSSVGLGYPFAAAIAKGFQDAAAKAGVNAIILDAQGRVQKQANDVDDLIGQKVNGIALMPLDSVVAQSWVDRACAAGIAVVAVGSQIGDPKTRGLQDVYPKLVALITQDEVAAGRQAGNLRRGFSLATERPTSPSLKERPGLRKFCSVPQGSGRDSRRAM